MTSGSMDAVGQILFFLFFCTSKAFSRVKVLLVLEVQIPVVKVEGLYIVLNLGGIYCVGVFFVSLGFFSVVKCDVLNGGWVLF